MGAFMKINKKVMYSIIAVNIILTIIGYVANKSIIQNKMNLEIKTTTEEKSKSLEYIIDHKKSMALNAVKWFENSDVLLKAINENSRSDIIQLGKKAMSDFGLDYWVVTDIDGNVIVRAHEPDNYGDSIANQVNIQNALKGEISAGIEEGAVVKLSIRAGCPIKDNEGRIIGVVSTGYILSDNFVDEVNKTLSCDLTIFNGMERVGTTLKEKEKRITGTILYDNEIEENVLNKGNSVTKLITISGIDYYSVYSPLVDINNNVIGMYFVGVPAHVIESLIIDLTVYQLLISFSTLILSLLVLYFILRKYLTIPLNKLVKFFKELARGEGDLTKNLDVITNDEVGEVMNEFNKFITKLKSIISQVKESSYIVREETRDLSDRVSSCTDLMIEISRNISKISDNMMGNSAAIEETTASTQEINKVSNMVAKSCVIVSEQSILANEITQEGSKAIQDIITSIKNISNSSDEVIVKIYELQKLSNKINEVVTIITDISDQTNLLSINASIEAARAGEYGKGFSVIADDVKKLAEESNKSSHEIINIIHDVQCNIKDTALKVDTVSKNINLGVDKAIVVDERFKKISEAICIVSEKAHDIAAASQEQAASIEQISSAMDEIAKITMGTAEDANKMNIAIQHEKDNMKEANIATKHVSEIVRELNLIADKFKTK